MRLGTGAAEAFCSAAFCSETFADMVLGNESNEVTGMICCVESYRVFSMRVNGVRRWVLLESRVLEISCSCLGEKRTIQQITRNITKSFRVISYCFVDRLISSTCLSN